MANVRQLTPLLAEKARNELNESIDRITGDIRLLREWLTKQPHLKTRTDDQFLLAFIRASKYSLERAKKKLDLFYTIRTSMPEIFKDRQPDDPRVLEVLRLGTFMMLPKPMSEDGPRICIIRPGLTDPQKHTIYDSVRPGTFFHDLGLINDDNIIVAGVIEIIDLTNVTMAHFFQFDAVFMKKAALLGGDGSVLRHKGTHFINAPSAFETLFNLFKTFLTEKQKSRLYVHGTNLESFYKHVPKKMLPKEFGGENGSISEIVTHSEKQLEVHRDYLIEENNYGAIESLRPADSPFSAESLFGVDGTFRKLNVD